MKLEPWDNPGFYAAVSAQFGIRDCPVAGPVGADTVWLWEGTGPLETRVCLAKFRYTSDTGWLVTASDVDMPGDESFPHIHEAMEHAKAWRIRQGHPWFHTGDGVLIVDGLRVWTNDLVAGSVDFAASGVDADGYGTVPDHWQGWFRVRLDAGGHILMNGERLATVHPVDRTPPPPAPASVSTGTDGVMA